MARARTQSPRPSQHSTTSPSGSASREPPREPSDGSSNPHLPTRSRSSSEQDGPGTPRRAPPAATWQPPFLLAVLFAPFRLGYRVAATLVRSVFYLFSLLPPSLRPRAVVGGGGGGGSWVRKGWGQGGQQQHSNNTNGRRTLMPRDTAARFRREFEEQYGAHALPFFDGGAAQAQDQAKKNLQFLLIVLLSPEHDDTDPFVRDTLLSPEVVAFINDGAAAASSNNNNNNNKNNTMLLWGGNVQDSEAYQVSLEYNYTKFPFSALVCLTPKEGSARMGIVKRLTGPMSPAAYVAGLQAAIAKYAPDLDAVRAERAANEMARSLRSEQDDAYERSLARDRERARQRREAEAAAQAAEKAQREQAAAEAAAQEKRAQWRRWRAVALQPEPPAGRADVVRLALNMPASAGAGGGRVVRRFDGKASLEELYAFVECYEILEGTSASASTWRPRRCRQGPTATSTSTPSG